MEALSQQFLLRDLDCLKPARFTIKRNFGNEIFLKHYRTSIWEKFDDRTSSRDPLPWRGWRGSWYLLDYPTHKSVWLVAFPKMWKNSFYPSVPGFRLLVKFYSHAWGERYDFEVNSLNVNEIPSESPIIRGHTWKNELSGCVEFHFSAESDALKFKFYNYMTISLGPPRVSVEKW